MKRHMNKLLLLAAALLIVLGLTGCGASTTTIDLNDYITITTSGYEAMGHASYTFDRDAFENDWGDTIELTKAAEKDEEFNVIAQFYDSGAELLCDMGYFSGSLDQNSDLSNGDTVTFSWNIGEADEEEIETYFKVKLEYSDITYTVSGLEEITSFDAFSGVSVTFSGYAPNGEASLSVNNSLLSSSAYSLSQTSGLSNGDVVTVTVSSSAADSLMSSDGVYPETLTKEFTVEGLAGYATTLSDIPDSALEKMDSQARDSLAALVASDWDSEVRTLDSMELLGYYFLSAKEGYYTDHQNIIYLVYQINATQMGESMSYYWCISFYDGILLSDGTFSMDYATYDPPDYDWGSGENGFDYISSDEDQTGRLYVGYQDLDTLFNKQVTTKIEEYTYESTVEAP